MLTMRANLERILCAVVLIFLVTTPITHNVLAQGTNIDELLSKYGKPLVVPIRNNLSNICVTFIDSSRESVLLVGSKEGVTVATLMSSKYFEAQGGVYPLLGTMSSYDIDDTYSPSHYAFGSSKGEVLVLSPEDLSLKFKYVQGDEFRVNKVFISKNILAAMFVGSRTFVKVFNLSTGGWSEYGEVVGNAPRHSTEGIKLIDFSLLKFTYGNKISTKDTMVLAYYTIPINKLLVQVINASTNEPLADAIVYVRNDILGTIYQGITDREGYALVPIDLTTKKQENITIFVKVENICYKYTFENVELQEISTGVYTIGKVISIPGGSLSQLPQVVRRLVLDVIDLSSTEPKRIKTLNRDDVILLKIHAFLDVTILGQQYRYLLVVSGRFASDPNYPSLRIMYLDSSFTLLSETKYRLFSDVSALTYTPDGRFIIIGTQGGTIYVLRSTPTDGKYEVLWSYRMPAQVTSLTVANKVDNGIAIVAGDAKGNVQVLYLPTANKMIPMLRLNTSLTYNVGSPITSICTSLDLNTLIIGTEERSYLVYGLGDYIVESSKAIDLRTRELQPLSIRVVTVNGTAVANAYIKVYNTEGVLIAEGITDANGTYSVDYILPDTYNITVQPPVEYLQRASLLVSITKEVQEITITCNYTTITVYFSVLDSETKGAVEESVSFTLSGPETFMRYNVVSGNSSFYIKLLPGHYKITVSPSKYVIGRPLYQEAEAYIDVPKDKNVTIYLARNTFRLAIRFMDNATRGPPKEPVKVMLYKDSKLIASSIITTYKNTLTLTLRDKGVFTVKIQPLPPENEEPYYTSATYIINVTSDTQETILLHLNYIKLVLNVVDEKTGGPPLTSVRVVLDERYTTILQANTSKLTLEVTKGGHTITLVPEPEFSYLKIPLYNTTELYIDVVRETSLNVTLRRVYFKVVLNIIDYYTGSGPAEKLVLMINNIKVAEIPPNATAPVSFNTYLHVGENIIQLKGRNIYTDYIKKVIITNETTIDVELLRKLFTLKLVIVNDIGQKLSGGMVEALGINLRFEASSSIIDGEAYLKLPFGMYSIKVTQPGYEKFVAERVVDHDMEVSIVLYPTIITLLTRYLPVIVGVSVIAAIIALIFKYRARIKSLIAPEEELF